MQPCSHRLVSADLRKLESLRGVLEAGGLRTDRPTLVLAECVLVYMEPDEGAALVRFLGETLDDAAMVVYDMVNANDAFG